MAGTNMLCSGQIATNENYRDNYDRIFSKNGLTVCPVCDGVFYGEDEVICKNCRRYDKTKIKPKGDKV